MCGVEFLVTNPVWKFLCLVICSQTCTSGFFTCNDVAVGHYINVLTKNNEMELFKVMGFPTQIFSSTDRLIGEGGMNCSLNESCSCSCAEMCCPVGCMSSAVCDTSVEHGGH